MTERPLVNALVAGLYIIAIANVAHYVPPLVQDAHEVAAVAAVLSLLVLSVAFMGYTFFFEPFVLCVNGQVREAARLFLTTLAAFAVLTLFAFGALFILSGV